MNQSYVPLNQNSECNNDNNIENEEKKIKWTNCGLSWRKHRCKDSKESSEEGNEKNKVSIIVIAIVWEYNINYNNNKKTNKILLGIKIKRFIALKTIFGRR